MRLDQEPIIEKLIAEYTGKDCVLELGSGNAPKGDVNIDIVNTTGPDDVLQEGTGYCIHCVLGFEAIPFPDDFFSKVQAHHTLEHIPFVHFQPEVYADDMGAVHMGPRWQRLLPMVDLFNEVWRVLKVGGTFEIWLPQGLTAAALTEPTHCSYWSDNTINYFSGDYFSFHDLYEHKSNFKLVHREGNATELHFILQKREANTPLTL